MDLTIAEAESLDMEIKTEVWPECLDRTETIPQSESCADESHQNTSMDIKLNVVKTEPITPPHYVDYEVFREGTIDMNMIKHEMVTKTESTVNHDTREEESNTWMNGPVPVAIYKSLVCSQSESGIDNKHQETIPNSHDLTTDQCLSAQRTRTEYQDARPYKCSLCLYRSANVANLKTHERTHTGEKPYSCSVCSYSAAQKGDLAKHERTHTGDKPYRCTMCSFSVAVKSSLKRHERTHTGDKPYRCTMCSYITAQKGNLINHERTHTGDKPYKCTVCTFCAVSRASLKAHERTHTGDKPYRCTMCSFRSAAKFSLNRHKRTHNPTVPTT